MLMHSDLHPSMHPKRFTNDVLWQRECSKRELDRPVFRILEAALKAVFGLIPAGHQAGAKISPCALPAPSDLRLIMFAVRSVKRF